MTIIDVQVEDGTELFRALARGIVALGASDWSTRFTLPYPDPAQRALDRVVLAALRSGEKPPLGMSQLITWCAERTADCWPFDVASALVGPEATLVDRELRVPSRTCVELAAAGQDDGPLRQAETVLSNLAVKSTTARLYQRCRDFLIDRVIVTQDDVFDRTWKPLVWQRVNSLYGPVPPGYAVTGLVARCPTCGLLARVVDECITWCESTRCPRGVPADRTYDVSKSQVLGTALRLFLCLPGRTERLVLARLGDRKVTAAIVAGTIGTYQLSEPVHGRHTMRVLDWVEPALLAHHLAGESDLLVIVPAALVQSTPGYLKTAQSLLADNNQITVISSDDL